MTQATQRFQTGRSSEFADGIAPLSFADLILKDFFQSEGLLPSGAYTLEGKYTFPAPDFQNLNGGTFTRNMSAGKYQAGGGGASNIGWNMGALYQKVLFILGGMRMQSHALGLFMSPDAQAASDITNAYLFLPEANLTRTSFYKAPAFSLLASDGSVTGGYQDVNNGLAFYFDGSTNRLIGFYRMGSEVWIPILDITDASFTSMQYVGFRMDIAVGSGGGDWVGCPLAIYAGN